ncbi:unnamed protein product [Ilex paraguariensis]|uniref:Uncharacterized protein n=1 Tax=Ilex paraguariensis TaxID=185542 RepID=A0ABC8UKJ4_9AQUA
MLRRDQYHTLAWDTGKIVGNVDANQLKNTMTAISQNGRFIAAATFIDDVKAMRDILFHHHHIEKVCCCREAKNMVCLNGHC